MTSTPRDESECLGIISEVKLQMLKLRPGYQGLSRVAAGIENVFNPPSDLFHSVFPTPFPCAWRRVGETDSFELDLGVPVGEKVECHSLEGLAIRLRTNCPENVNDIRYREFDFSVSLLLLWVKRLWKSDYRDTPFGLITPRNVFVVRWEGWKPEGTSPGSTSIADVRMVLADLGFRHRGSGTTPPWLENDSVFSFLWDEKPADVYQSSFAPSWGIPSLARLIAHLLQPDIGIQEKHKSLSRRALQSLPEPRASIWKVLDDAIHGAYGVDLSGLDRFIKEVTEHRPSLHFAYSRGELVLAGDDQPSVDGDFDSRKPPAEKDPDRSTWKRRLAIWATVLFLLCGASFWLLWQYTGETRCVCCPKVSSSSPIFSQLLALDELRSQHGIKLHSDSPESSTAGNQPAKASVSTVTDVAARVPIREGSRSVELEAISEVHQAARQWREQNPNSRLREAEAKCLKSLRMEYAHELLCEEFFDVRGRLGGGLAVDDAFKHYQQISEDLKRLRELADVESQEWEDYLHKALKESAASSGANP